MGASRPGAFGGWLIALAFVSVDWARHSATREQRVLGFSAFVLFGGAWLYYTFAHEYPYAVFKMSTWLQFMVVPIVAYGLYRLWAAGQGRSVAGSAPASRRLAGYRRSSWAAI